MLLLRPKRVLVCLILLFLPLISLGPKSLLPLLKSSSVHNCVMSSEHDLVYIVTYDKGKSFHYYICYKDSALRVVSRSVPIDVRAYQRSLYKALSIACAAYYRIAED